VEQGGKSSRKERRMKNRVVKEHQISELATAEGDEQEGDIEREGATDVKPVDAGELIQVIHKIQSFQSGPSQHIVFSAVGASALFMAPLPSGGGTAASNSTQAYDFTRPVVDFTLDAEGIAWVLLDGGWGENTEALPLVKRIQCNPAGDFQEVEDGPEKALILSLNTTCRLPATPEELKALELYALLSSMPKNLSDEPDDESKAQVAGTKRHQGRLKNKKFLMQAVEGSHSEPPEGDAEERTVKRTKSTSDDVEDAMDEP